MRRLGPIAAFLVISAMVATACGVGDDRSETSSSTQQPSTTQAPLDIEGVIQKDTKKGHFDEYEFNAKVTDGRLTIKPSSGAQNPKLCFVELRSLKAP